MHDKPHSEFERGVEHERARVLSLLEALRSTLSGRSLQKLINAVRHGDTLDEPAPRKRTKK